MTRQNTLKTMQKYIIDKTKDADSIMKHAYGVQETNTPDGTCTFIIRCCELSPQDSHKLTTRAVTQLFSRPLQKNKFK